MDPTLFPGGQCRLIIIGKTGNGKSSTGNSILGYQAFQTQVGLNSILDTTRGPESTILRNGVELQVMDTPGVQDTALSEEVTADHLTRSLLAISPGPHSILLCLACDQRFTAAELHVIETLKQILGEAMMSYLVVVMVKRDFLERAKVRFEDQLKDCTELKRLLTEANNRYVLFDNRPKLSPAEKAKQLHSLLEKVTEVVRHNRGHFHHRLSAQLDISMRILRRAEPSKEMEHNDVTPAHSKKHGQLGKPPKPTPRLTGKAGQSSQTSHLVDQSMTGLQETQLVTKRLQCFEERQPALKYTQPQTSCQLCSSDNKHQQTEPPPKPPRFPHGYDQTTETNPERTSPHQQPQDSTGLRNPSTGSAPSGSVKPWLPEIRSGTMTMEERRAMVEEALKRKVAQGTGLTPEQKKFREGFRTLAAHTADMCRLM